MNSQEQLNALKQAMTCVFAVLTALMPGVAASQNFSLIETGLLTAAPALLTLGSMAWSIYSHWNMKKVPETSTAISTPAALPVGSTVTINGSIAKVAAALLIGFLALHAAPAMAQTKKLVLAPATSSSGVPCDPLSLIPGCTPTAVSQSLVTNSANLQTIWNEIVSATQADLTYAKAMADNVASPGSKLRSTCYAALITANAQANGMTLKNADGTPMVAPTPAAISKFEQAAELIDNLQATAPVMSACAAAANAVAQSTTQFLTTILSTVAVKAAVPVIP